MEFIPAQWEVEILETNSLDSLRWEQENFVIKKGVTAAPIGTIHTIAGIEYIKTPEGWRYHSKGTRKATQDYYKDKKQPIPTHLTGDIKQFRDNNGGFSSSKVKEGATITSPDGTQGTVVGQAGDKYVVKYKDKDGVEKTVNVDAKVVEDRVAAGNLKHEPGKDEKNTHPLDHPDQIKQDAQTEKKLNIEKQVKDSQNESNKPQSNTKAASDGSLPNKESIKQDKVLALHDGVDKENIEKEGFAVKSPTTTESDDSEVGKRFSAFARFTRGVIAGRMKCLLAYGSGGVGKTYGVMKELAAAGKKAFDPGKDVAGDKTYDYVKFSGKMTPAALYRAMYEHNGKVMVFDDCDSVLKDPDAVNLFKGALDTSGDGGIDWGKASNIKDSYGGVIPQKFKFDGKVIFISNIPIDDSDEKNREAVKNSKNLQPILSRGYSIDLTMTPEETMQRIEGLAKTSDGKLTNLKFPGDEDYTSEDMRAVLDYMKKNQDKARDINVRTVGTLLGIKKQADEEGVKDWTEDAKYQFIKKAEEVTIFDRFIDNFNLRKSRITESFIDVR